MSDKEEAMGSERGRLTAAGCAGASRLVCKSEWDYKFILKFDDIES